MIFSTLDTFTAGRFWMSRCLMALVIVTVLFNCAPAVLVNREMELPPAYELKSQHPLADTSLLTVPKHPGERSHGAKLTPRLAGAILLFLAAKLSLHPYVPATLGGIAFLLSGLVVGYRLSADRVIGLLVGVTFAGLYTSAACFAVNWMPKPFDGVAFGLLGLTAASMAMGRVWLFALTAFLSCWTDERAIVSLGLIALLILFWPGLDAKGRQVRCLVLGGAVAAYALSRFILAQALHWRPPDTSLVGSALPVNLNFSLWAVWTCFKGGWIPLAVASWMLLRSQAYLQLGLLAGSVALAIASCLLVADISRAGSFAFPLIPVALVVLKRQAASRPAIRMVAAACAVVSLLMPNFEIIGGIGVKWLPPLSLYGRLKLDDANTQYNLGVARARKGQTTEAIRYFREAVRLKPDNPEFHCNLGAVLFLNGQSDEAICQFQETIRLKPDHAEARYNLGVSLAMKGRTDEAIRQYQEAIRLKPDNADAHYNLGIALGRQGQIDEAIRHFEAALQVKPDYAEAHNQLGLALITKGQRDAAVGQFREALRLKPGYADARNNLDAALATGAQIPPPPGAATNH
jgi:Flp pilus assembly protein TadD